MWNSKGVDDIQTQTVLRKDELYIIYVASH